MASERYRGYRASHPDLDVRSIPMSQIQSTPLPEDMEAFGPSMDFTGRPTDTMQRAHSQGLMDRESMVLADMGQGREQADMEVSREQQEALLAELSRIMAQNQVNARNAPGSLGASLQIPALPERSTRSQNLDKLSFGAAFRLARASGASVFTWRGRRFTTRLR